MANMVKQKADIPIIMTHAWMSYDPNHIAIVEMRSFAQLIEKWTRRRVKIVFHDELVSSMYNCPDGTFDMIVFWSSADVHKSVTDTMSRARRSYVVIPDPNWNASLKLDKPVTLITPFEALDNCDTSDVIHRLGKYGMMIDESSIDDHVFMPFGEMAFHNPHYMRKFVTSPQIRSRALPPRHDRAKGAYAGSLKASRGHLMAHLARLGEADIFGNMTSESLDAYARDDEGSFDELQKHVRGKVPALQVWRAYAGYDEAVMITDPAMTDLRTHYMRPLEYALAARPVRIIGDDDELVKRDQEYFGQILMDDTTGCASLSKLRDSYSRDLHERIMNAWG